MISLLRWAPRVCSLLILALRMCLIQISTGPAQCRQMVRHFGTRPARCVHVWESGSGKVQRADKGSVARGDFQYPESYESCSTWRSFGGPGFGMISGAGQARQIQVGARIAF